MFLLGHPHKSDVGLDKGPQSVVGAEVIGIYGTDDLALIRIPTASEAFAALGGGAIQGDPLLAVGFPKRGDREEFDQFTAQYEGQTQFFLSASGRAGVEVNNKAVKLRPALAAALCSTYELAV